MDINKELAEALGKYDDYVSNRAQCGDKAISFDDWLKSFDYRDPVIFAECMTALPDGVVIFKGPLWGIYSDWRDFENAIALVENEDLFKAVALAVIQAKEG